MWLLRAARWVRNPPSWQRVVLVASIVAICIAVATVEWLGLWPEALTLERVNLRKIGG